MRTLIPSILILVSWPLAKAAACGNDTDCKGDRVCEDGRCVSPGPAVAPAPAAPMPAPPATLAAEHEPARPSAPDLEAMRRALQLHGAQVAVARAAAPEKVIGGYAEVSYLYKHSAFGDLKGTPAHSGIHLAGHRALTNKVHLGGYLAYLSVGEQHLVAGGISLKVGSWIKDRAWLGLAYNHGIEVVTGHHAFGLMQISPRLQLDVLLLRTPGFALAANLSTGPEILANGAGAGGCSSLTFGLTLGR
jgi:hypothetical protein